MRQEQHTLFTGWTEQEQKRLGLENIFKRCFPDQTYEGTKITITLSAEVIHTINTAHRALEDVKAMNQIFQNDSFSTVLKHLTYRSIAQIFSEWEAKRFDYIAAQKAVAEYGRGTTKAMANCLVQLQLTSDKIEAMFSSSLSVSSFDDNLKKAGVKMKSWRTKLWNHFSKKK